MRIQAWMGQGRRTSMRVLGVFAIMAAIAAGHADAHPAPRPLLPQAYCRVEDAVYPPVGATDVPLDAKVWVIQQRDWDGDVDGEGDGDVAVTLNWNKQRRELTPTRHPFGLVELDVGQLRPHQRYRVLVGHEELTHFTTGAKRDRTPPAPPTIVAASAVSDLATTSNIKVVVETEPDAILTETTVRVEGGEVLATLLVPPRTLANMGTECGGYSIWATRLCFDVHTVDVAGNRSTPTTECVQAEQGPGLERSYDNRSYDVHPVADTVRGPAEPSWKVLGLVLLAPLLLGWLVLGVRAWRARSIVLGLDALPVELDLIRRVARRQRTAAEIGLALAGAALIGLELVHDATVHAIFATVPIFVIVLCIGNARRLCATIAALDDPDANPVLDGTRFVFVGRDRWLVTSEAALQRAADQAIPRATVRNVT